MFIDKAVIRLEAGRGGDGSVAFRREKFIPKGGPNGGDGGKGGDVTFVATPRLKTLLDFVKKPVFKAANGERGSGWKKTGRHGPDLVLEVPCGTVLKEQGEVVADLLHAGDRMMVARGGRGGRGNVHFKNSVRQAPRIAEKGEPGENREIALQLKLIADVGLIGFPNAGKSTLLSRLTRANPKIAAYPFTTLFPNLGVAALGDQEIVFADIPGLIEGSHQGKGLGHAFLNHIERTKMVVHVVDPLGYDGRPPRACVKTINEELRKYSRLLATKPQILVVNKQDLTGAAAVAASLKKAFRKVTVLPISAVSGSGVPELLRAVSRLLQAEPPPPPAAPLAPPARVRLEPRFWVEQTGDGFVVHGRGPEQIVAMTNFDYPEAVERTQHILRKMGVERALLASGARVGAQVTIAGVPFDFDPDNAGKDKNTSWKSRRRRAIR